MLLETYAFPVPPGNGNIILHPSNSPEWREPFDTNFQRRYRDHPRQEYCRVFKSSVLRDRLIPGVLEIVIEYIFSDNEEKLINHISQRLTNCSGFGNFFSCLMEGDIDMVRVLWSSQGYLDSWRNDVWKTLCFLPIGKGPWNVDKNGLPDLGDSFEGIRKPPFLFFSRRGQFYLFYGPSGWCKVSRSLSDMLISNFTDEERRVLGVSTREESLQL